MVVEIKDLIEYYYRFSEIKLHKKGQQYMFDYNGDTYFFSPLYRTEREIYEIFRIVANNQEYDQIVENIYKHLVTVVYQKKYIMTKKSRVKKNVFMHLIDNHYININNLEIDHSNWVYLWEKKIDNIEYQMSHIENKYPLLNSSIDYYIGMAENAILYIKTSLGISQNINKKTISHIRFLDDNYNNPQNIVIDYKSRDIAEYLKYAFFKEKYSYDEINLLLNKIYLDEIAIRLIYGRLLFPTFYFDLYDKIINNQAGEKELLLVINKNVEYEDYLENIYNLLNSKKKIPKITWI